MKKISILITVVSTFIVSLTQAQEVHHGESFELDAPLNATENIEYKATDYIHLKKGFLRHVPFHQVNDEFVGNYMISRRLLQNIRLL